MSSWNVDVPIDVTRGLCLVLQQTQPRVGHRPMDRIIEHMVQAGHRAYAIRCLRTKQTAA